MTLLDRLADLGQSAVLAIGAGIVGGIGWVVRNILTNKALIASQEAKLESLEKGQSATNEGLARIEKILIEKALNK